MQSSHWHIALPRFTAAALLLTAFSSYAEEAAPARTALKVCADPYSLPSSNKAGEGYENKIAELFGRQLGLPVEFTWFPQRLGFVRNTLTNNETADGSYQCDLIMGVVENFELAATTRPYLHSTWAMVYVKGRGLDYIQRQEDLLDLTPEQKGALRIGIWDKGPATQFVAQNDLMDQAVPYQSMSGDAREGPGQMIERELLGDKVNLTFVWGPIAGYYAKQIKPQKLVVIPMHGEPGLRFDFQIAMAVRFPDEAWKRQVDGLIADNQSAIDAILREYGAPMMPLLLRETEDDDDHDDD